MKLDRKLKKQHHLAFPTQFRVNDDFFLPSFAKHNNGSESIGSRERLFVRQQNTFVGFVSGERPGVEGGRGHARRQRRGAAGRAAPVAVGQAPLAQVLELQQTHPAAQTKTLKKNQGKGKKHQRRSFFSSISSENRCQTRMQVELSACGNSASLFTNNNV